MSEDETWQTDKEKIKKIIDDLIDNVDFVSEFALVVPMGATEKVFETLNKNSELLHNRFGSWSIHHIRNDGIVIRFDNTNQDLRGVIR